MNTPMHFASTLPKPHKPSRRPKLFKELAMPIQEKKEFLDVKVY